MEGLYSKPLRVYLLLGAMAIWGILSGTQLPISLFPNSTQPTIAVMVSYGSLSAQQFYESIGRGLEPKLQAIRANKIGVKIINASYYDKNARFVLEFDWGAEPEEARKLAESEAASYLAPREESIRRSLRVRNWSDNSGFLAVSFFSPLRSLDEVYDILNPFVIPMGAKVPDATEVELYNPSNKEIAIRLLPEQMALHQVSTVQVERAIRDAVFSLNGGTIRIGERDFQINIPKQVSSIENLNSTRISPLSRTPVLLKDIAQISVVVSKERQRKFKTSGVESVLIFADPKEGGNIKRMADDIMAEIRTMLPQLPADVEYRVLVNPADFINKSVSGVLREVGLAAFLAVVILFLFIGSLRNVATAAIEIPLSLVMAFILMKMTGMNLNMISLGGLALSAGMNVDASVVVLENIFRHFEKQRKDLLPQEKLRILIGAVNEVKQPIIASTIASLVVFAPLVFTQGLTNSLLGDLAKAVIFSHGLSAIVALVLVPTIRFHLMRSGDLSHPKSPIEGLLTRLESFYRASLGGLLKRTRLQIGLLLFISILLPALAFFVLPRLKKEVVGRPDSDYLIVGVNSPIFNSIKEMEAEIANLESELFKNFGSEVNYTFTQINGAKSGHVMIRLHSRKNIGSLRAKAEDLFKSTPTLFYWVEQWNPSELRIPDPADFEFDLIGGTPEQRQGLAEDIFVSLRDKGIFDKHDIRPSINRAKFISVNMLEHFSLSTEVLSRFDFSHFLRTALDGMFVEDLAIGAKTYPVFMRFPDQSINRLESLKALPFGFDGRLIPLGALAQFTLEPKPPEEYRHNQTSLVRFSMRNNSTNSKSVESNKAKARELLEGFKTKMANDKSRPASEQPTISVGVPDHELQQALDQLKWAVLISAVLIFLTMVLQLGDLIQSLLVMVAIPLGLIGVLSSLYIFQSSLSLNSGLGTILLNGIAVANSIILVDFISKLFSKGKSAFDATIEASSARLRPILMTSLTTGLGMLPIAMGMGEGGKILQPLGVAVCGGLWISTLMTLYVVPALQYQWLRRRMPLKGRLETHDFLEAAPLHNQNRTNEVHP